MFCRSFFVLLYFFFWPLCCLFFDIRILITPLLSSNSSSSIRVSSLILTIPPSEIKGLMSVVYGYSSVSICGGSMQWIYRKWRHRKWRHPEVTWAEEALTGSDRVSAFPRFFRTRVVVQMCHCAWPTGLPEVTWPLRVSLGVHMRNRKLRNIRPSGVLLTGSDVITRSDRRGLGWKDARMRNRKLRNIWPSGVFSPEVPLGCSLGRPRLSLSSPGYLPLLFS